MVPCKTLVNTFGPCTEETWEEGKPTAVASERLYTGRSTSRLAAILRAIANMRDNIKDKADAMALADQILMQVKADPDVENLAKAEVRNTPGYYVYAAVSVIGYLDP